MCVIYFKSLIKITKRGEQRRSGVFTVTFEQISYIVPVFSLLTLSRQISTNELGIAMLTLDGNPKVKKL